MAQGGILAGFAPAVSQGFRMPGFDALDAQRKATTANPLATNFTIDQPVMSGSSSMPKVEPLIDPKLMSAFIQQTQGTPQSSAAATPPAGGPVSLSTPVNAIRGEKEAMRVLRAMGGWVPPGYGNWRQQLTDLGFRWDPATESRLAPQGMTLGDILGVTPGGGLGQRGVWQIARALGMRPTGLSTQGGFFSGTGGLGSQLRAAGWSNPGTGWVPAGGADALADFLPMMLERFGIS